MVTRDVYLELLSPALARARRERAVRPVVPAPRPAAPSAEVIARPVLVRANR